MKHLALAGRLLLGLLALVVAVALATATVVVGLVIMWRDRLRRNV